MIVYLLWHVRSRPREEDCEKLIEVYSSAEQAQSATARAKVLPGFSEHPDGFEVSAYEIDKDHWTEGFVTV